MAINGAGASAECAEGDLSILDTTIQIMFKKPRKLGFLFFLSRKLLTSQSVCNQQNRQAFFSHIMYQKYYLT